jgi:hypothetical protein
MSLRYTICLASLFLSIESSASPALPKIGSAFALTVFINVDKRNVQSAVAMDDTGQCALNQA